VLPSKLRPAFEIVRASVIEEQEMLHPARISATAEPVPTA